MCAYRWDVGLFSRFNNSDAQPGVKFHNSAWADLRNFTTAPTAADMNKYERYIDDPSPENVYQSGPLNGFTDKIMWNASFQCDENSAPGKVGVACIAPHGNAYVGLGVRQLSSGAMQAVRVDLASMVDATNIPFARANVALMCQWQGVEAGYYDSTAAPYAAAGAEQRQWAQRYWYVIFIIIAAVILIILFAVLIYCTCCSNRSAAWKAKRAAAQREKKAAERRKKKAAERRKKRAARKRAKGTRRVGFNPFRPTEDLGDDPYNLASFFGDGFFAGSPTAVTVQDSEAPVPPAAPPAAPPALLVPPATPPAAPPALLVPPAAPPAAPPALLVPPATPPAAPPALLVPPATPPAAPPALLVPPATPPAAPPALLVPPTALPLPRAQPQPVPLTEARIQQQKRQQQLDPEQDDWMDPYYLPDPLLTGSMRSSLLSPPNFSVRVNKAKADEVAPVSYAVPPPPDRQALQMPELPVARQKPEKITPPAQPPALPPHPAQKPEKVAPPAQPPVQQPKVQKQTATEQKPAEKLSAERPPAKQSPPQKPPTDEQKSEKKLPVEQPPVQQSKVQKQTATGQKPAEKLSAERPPAKQSPPQKPPTDEQKSEKKLPVEQPPAKQPLAEQPPAEQPPAEQPPAAQPPRQTLQQWAQSQFPSRPDILDAAYDN